MRKIWLAIAVAAVVLLTMHAVDAQAELFSSCSPCGQLSCGPCDPPGGRGNSLWFVGGHLESGLFVNEYGQKNAYKYHNYQGTLDGDSGNTQRLQNVHQTDYQLNQLYFNLGKRLDTRRGWDIGGRVDFLYGTDARFVQSDGLERNAGRGDWNSGDYYTALPQMYFEAGYKNVSVKVGKFYSPLGHTSFLSPERFFYSLPLDRGVLPYTLSGVVGKWDVNKKLSVYGGWVNGEDRFFDTSDDNGFLGGLEYHLNHRVKIGYGFLAGKNKQWDDNDYKNAVEDAHLKNYFVHSFFVGVKLNKRWDYAFEWTLRNEKGEAYDEPNDFLTRRLHGEYGINQELIYKINSAWAAGLRMEWEHGYYSTRQYQGGSMVNDGGIDLDVFSLVLGVNWKPCSWFVFRPELRYDKYEHLRDFNRARNNGADAKKDQLSGGFSTIVVF